MKTIWPTIRDIILFFAGLAGVANEAMMHAVERPTLLAIYGAMMGLPAFLRKDEQKIKAKKNGDSES